jgi:hypothetical protein
MEIKRYVVTCDYYLSAESDEEAIKLAVEFESEQKDLNDNHFAILSIVEQPFGTIGNREIFKK